LSGFAGSEIEKTVYALGRAAAYLAKLFKGKPAKTRDFSSLACRAVAGRSSLDREEVRMIEGAIVACVDHGLTPPSAQATVLAASVRAAFEVAVASGIAAITDVHGGAGAKAAEFFRECVERSDLEGVIAERASRGERIEGLGHRIHTHDPRRDALWELARKTNVAGECVALSTQVVDAFAAVRGIDLPVNVDGVIGAIVADMGLDPQAAKAIFLFGRIAGLAAHYFEEVATQPPMRRIDFAQAVYRAH
jgi:citrate synthase